MKLKYSIAILVTFYLGGCETLQNSPKQVETSSVDSANVMLVETFSKQRKGRSHSKDESSQLEVVWDRSLRDGGANRGAFSSLSKVERGGFFAVGTSGFSPNQDVRAIKLNRRGQIVSDHLSDGLSGSRIYDLTKERFGTFYAAGARSGLTATIWHFDEEGRLIFSTELPKGENGIARRHYFETIMQSSDSTMWLGGKVVSTRGEPFVANFSRSGQLLEFIKIDEIASMGSSGIVSLSELENGNLYAAAEVSDGNNSFIAAFEMDKSGNVVSRPAFFGSFLNNDESLVKQIVSGNNVYSVGGNGIYGIITKHKVNGDIVWRKFYAHERQEGLPFNFSNNFNSATISETGDLWVAGKTSGKGWILHLNSDGEVLVEGTVDTNIIMEELSDIVVSSDGNPVFLVNAIEAEGNAAVEFGRIVKLKYKN